MENLYSYLEAACKNGDEDAVCRFLKEDAAVGSVEESHSDIINHRDKKGLIDAARPRSQKQSPRHR